MSPKERALKLRKDLNYSYVRFEDLVAVITAAEDDVVERAALMVELGDATLHTIEQIAEAIRRMKSGQSRQ